MKKRSIQQKWRIGFAIFTIFSTIFSTKLAAQDDATRRFGGGLVLGFNASQIEGDAASGYRKVGFNVGLRGKIRLADPRMWVTTDLLWSQRGSRTDQYEDLIMRRIHLDYIEIPVLFHYGDWQKTVNGKSFYAVSLAAGLSYGRLFNASFNEHAANFFRNPPTTVFRNNDIAYTGAVSFATSAIWSYSVRYTRSLNLLTNDPLGQLRWQGYFLSFASHFDF